MKTIDRSTIAALQAKALTLAAPTAGQELHSIEPEGGITYSPYPQEDFPNQVLFGATHLHTSWSADAGMVGATTTPDDAYRFAKGSEVISSQGVPARLERPLDFLVVSAHAENLGLAVALDKQDPVLEIPTPRWTTYDAAFFNIERPADLPPSQQERAYPSPIWCAPAS